MTIEDRRRRGQEAEEKREGDMGEGSFSQTHQAQPPSPPNVKGPRHVPVPDKDQDD